MLPLEGSESKQKTYISTSIELRTDHTELHSFMRGLRLSARLWPHVRTQRQCEAAPSPWYCLQHMLLCVCVCVGVGDGSGATARLFVAITVSVKVYIVFFSFHVSPRWHRNNLWLSSRSTKLSISACDFSVRCKLGAGITDEDTLQKINK